MGKKHSHLKNALGSGNILILVLLTLIVLAGASVGWALYAQQHKINDLRSDVAALTKRLNGLVTTYTSPKGNTIKVFTPLSGEKVTSPFYIVGEDPGGWGAEASFPVKLKDHNGTVIAQGPAQLHDDWMTDELVPFTAKLTFPAQPAGTTGTLVLENANPSGLPDHADSVSIPVKF